MDIRSTRHGLRLSQHGVVISELRSTPGPTHSVFDVLAALIAVLKPEPAARIGVLGFAGGGMMAPLRSLGVESEIHSVDLERAGYDLFRKHCHEWAGCVNWQQADAVAWLRRQPPDFGMLLEDLSVPQDGDVVKPSVSWSVLPGLIRQRLRYDGIAVFNLLPPRDNWRSELQRIAGLFEMARLVSMDEFENRILVAGNDVAPARELGRKLRHALHHLRSRQAARIQLRNIPSSRTQPDKNEALLVV